MKSGLRSDFPILQRKVDGRPLIYFDNGATSQKPRQVIEAISHYYKTSNANVHRGIHFLAEEATLAYEDARKKVAKFINAKSEKEIIFVRNTTEAINLLAYTLKPKEITTTIMEHHSNYLPWKHSGKLNVVDINNNYELKKELAGDFIAVTQASNVLGTINKIPKVKNGVVVVDGAQAVPHFKVDVQDLGCDFYAFSAHKMFGPMGIGVLWGRQELLEKMPPFLWGGGMITLELPDKFEAGTPNVAGAVGLAAAIDYINSIGYENILNFEFQISNLLIEKILKIPEITLYGPNTVKNRVPTFSFSIKNVHPHDAAQFLNDKYGIAVRAGQHCAGPLHERLGVSATVRASLAFYNTEEEVDIFIKAIKDLVETLG